ncbi:MAG: GNAT family N-acetyltransferase [Fusobacterium sp. JB021]|nr:GNAT family N-acetyltransferase [Fusobacterium sp. JB021]MDP0505627.1 GNAT family N-acetyltransferase [Fusobacterium sp. JB019]
MKLRKIVNKEDTEKLYEIEKKIFKEESYSFKQIEELFFLENYSCFFLIDHSGIKGYIIIFDNSEDIEVMKIGVLESQRNKGLGKKIITNIKKIGKNIFLEVRETNFSAISFYKENDFKIIGKRKGYYKNKEAAILMLFSNGKV